MNVQPKYIKYCNQKLTFLILVLFLNTFNSSLAQIREATSPTLNNLTNSQPIIYQQNPHLGGTNSKKEYNNFIKESNKANTNYKPSCPTRYFKPVDFSAKTYNQTAAKYITAYNEINMMFANDTSINLKRAVYLVEKAYLKQSIEYNYYLKLIQEKVEQVKILLKKEKLNETNFDAVHYAIQKLYSDTLIYKQKSGLIKVVKPMTYDFIDPFGEKDITKPLVLKLLITGKGQCRSLPLLYMILAEEFKIKANIAYSPAHSFIKFQTKNGTWYNFEATNGRLTTDAFVLGSGFVKSEALKSEIFNKENTPKQVVANLFVDLAEYYRSQIGDDDFTQKCIGKINRYNPNYIYGKVLQSNFQTALTDLALAEECYPPMNYLSNYPKIKNQMNIRDNFFDELDNLGFTSMPKEAYNEWLKSLKKGQEKQNSDELKQQFKKQLN